MKREKLEVHLLIQCFVLSPGCQACPVTSVWWKAPIAEIKFLKKSISLDRCREVLINLANYHIRQIEKKPCCWASAWCKRDAASRRRRRRVAKSFLLILPPLYPPPLCVDDWKIKKIRFNLLAPSPPSHNYRPINWQANSWGCVVFEEGWISDEHFRRRNLWSFPEPTGGQAFVHLFPVQCPPPEFKTRKKPSTFGHFRKGIYFDSETCTYTSCSNILVNFAKHGSAKIKMFLHFFNSIYSMERGEPAQFRGVSQLRWSVQKMQKMQAHQNTIATHHTFPKT